MKVYSATKAALRAFGKVLAAELLPRGISRQRCESGFHRHADGGRRWCIGGRRAAFMNIGDLVTPMKRHGTPEEVASAVLFLAFDATFTTGERMKVDGGLGQRLTASMGEAPRAKPPAPWTAKVGARIVRILVRSR